jgi:UDP-glucose 4-epimerase
MKNKKIIIFGSSGFLGSHLVNALYQNNDVIQFDINPPELEYEGTIFLKGSILDKALVQKAIKDVDIVYHFAAMTDIDYVNNNPAEAIEINIAGTSNILDACIKQKVERFVFSSSVYVYSKYGGTYKFTKQANELLIKDYDKMHDLNYTIIQLGSVFGPGAKQSNLINRFIYEGYVKNKLEHFGTGDEIRKYIFIYDVVDALIECMDKKYNKRKVILLGNESMSISRLMDQIISFIGGDIKKVFKMKDYNIHYRLSPFDIDPDDAILFNFNSPTNLKEGLKKTVNSMKVK